MKHERLHKLNLLIQKKLSSAINAALSEEFGIICVNCVLTNKDLSSAKVYVSSIQNKNKLIGIIKKNKRDINEKFIKVIKLRRIPRLEYFLDKKQEKIDRVEELLAKIKK